MVTFFSRVIGSPMVNVVPIWPVIQNEVPRSSPDLGNICCFCCTDCGCTARHGGLVCLPPHFAFALVCNICLYKVLLLLSPSTPQLLYNTIAGIQTKTC